MPMPNYALENGRADKQRAFGLLQWWRAAQRQLGRHVAHDDHRISRVEALIGLLYTAVLIAGWLGSAMGIGLVLRTWQFPAWFAVSLSVAVGLCIGMACQTIVVSTITSFGDKGWRNSSAYRDNIRSVARVSVVACALVASAIPLQMVVGSLRLGTPFDMIIVGGGAIVTTIAATRWFRSQRASAQPRAPSDPPQAGR
jgi:hypothetical protein